MKLRYHSDSSSFYDENSDPYPEPPETLKILENKLDEACQKLHSLSSTNPPSENSDDDLCFDVGLARFNLCSYIENLEWKIDLKLIHLKLNQISN